MTTTTTEVATLNLVTPAPSIVLNIGNREVVRINPDGTVAVNTHGGVYPVDKISEEFLKAMASSRVAQNSAELDAANERIARLRKALIEVMREAGVAVRDEEKVSDDFLCHARDGVTARLSQDEREVSVWKEQYAEVVTVLQRERAEACKARERIIAAVETMTREINDAISGITGPKA